VSAGHFSPFDHPSILLQFVDVLPVTARWKKEMPITVSYDLADADNNQRSYVRSMFERFGWQRMGGSVFRYERKDDEEDWLNDVAPALMMFRSYVLAKGITISAFTLDTNSVARIDRSDPEEVLGYEPDDGEDIHLETPSNVQSSEKRIRRGIDALINLFGEPEENSN
jgi:hypothetical protein